MHNKADRNGEASPPEYSQRPYYEDEINLLDIWRILVKQRKWILIITVLVLSISVAYALLAPKIYKVEAKILPPSSSDMEQLQSVQGAYQITGRFRPGLHPARSRLQSVQGAYQITGQELYNHFLTNLQSLTLRRQFYKKNNLLEILDSDQTQKANSEKVFEKFNKLLKINTPRKGKKFVTASLEGGNPIQAAKWLNDFIALADAHTVESISAAIKISIRLKKESVEREIKNLRKIAELERLDKQAQLEEGLLIATKLGLKQSVQDTLNKKPRAGSLLSVTLSTVEQPLYLRGSRALKAELNVLKKRTNDDAFIPGLRNLQKQLMSIKGIKFDTASIHAMRLEQAAYPPDSPIKPKRRLIVALGLMLGLMLGIFVAFIVNFVETARHQENSGSTHLTKRPNCTIG